MYFCDNLLVNPRFPVDWSSDYKFQTMQKINCYVEYLNRFPCLEGKLINIGTLTDGTVLCEMVQQIQDFPPATIEQYPETFAHRFSNLKLIMKSLEKYWQDMLALELQTEQIDLVQIAHNRKAQQLLKLFQLFIKTAVQAQNHDFFIQKIIETSVETQQLFRTIVEQTIGSKSYQSPRKQKQKRLYDKLLELDHQNDKLQQVISEICDEKLELDNKVSYLNEKLSEKNRDIQHLQEMHQEYALTPQKGRSYELGDTNEKQAMLVETLTQKLTDMAKAHHKELSYCREQIDYFEHKMERYLEIEGQLEHTKQALESFQDVDQAMTELNRKLNKQKMQALQKDNLIQQLKSKLTTYQKKTVQFQESEISYKLEIQAKRARIDQLINSKRCQDYTPTMSKHKSLFDQCPEITDKENQSLLETNQHLRNQLIKTTEILRSNEVQLDKLSRQNKDMRRYELENKKLMDIVAELSTDRGKENQFLTGIIYELGLKMQARKQIRQGGALKQPKWGQHYAT